MEKSPNYEFVVLQLEDHIKDVSDLISRLSDYGQPLSADEKATIREVMAGKWVRSVLDEARVGFFVSDHKMVEQSFQQVLNTLQDLS